MNDQIQKELIGRLDLLAAKLGVTADHLWGVLMRQARIEAITNIMFLIVVACLIYGYYRWAVRFLKLEDPIVDASAPETVSFVFAGIFLLIGSGVSIWGLFQLPGLLFNPEYWALQQIFSALK